MCSIKQNNKTKQKREYCRSLSSHITKNKGSFENCFNFNVIQNLLKHNDDININIQNNVRRTLRV